MAKNGDMKGQAGPYTPGRTLLWIGALLVVLALCYANSYDASWHYDDYGNIIGNPGVEATQWSWSSIKNSLSAGLNHQVIGRPLAYLSFALNHRLGGTNVTGYHLVNFVIHWLSAVFLFLLIRDTLRLPLFDGRYRRHAEVIALMAAVLWATHPIHVTAVTYIVQRMASLAGLFYLMTMYCYLKGRLSGAMNRRVGFFILGGCCAACALLTKENAVLVFYALWLFDLMLIQGGRPRRAGSHLLWILGLSVGIGLVGMLYTDLGNLFKPFEMRPFNWLERLMTQPRVFFFYLSLIAVPMTSRLSLLHDIEISRTLLMPWTTTAAFIGLILVFAALLWLARRHPLLAYCGLFYFLNHIVEGSILNLELIYEHRNYIPSMFLFLPLSILAVRCYLKLHRHRYLQWMTAGLVVLLTMSQMHTTFSYNRVFASGLTLWSDVVVKYPELSLGHLNLSKVYWDNGLFEKSAAENQTAIRLDRFQNNFQKALAYYNLGLFTSSKQQDFAKASVYFSKAQSISKSSGMWKKIAGTWMRQGEHARALNVLSDAEARWGEDSETYRMMGLAYLKAGHYLQAETLAGKALAHHPGDALSSMVIAQSLRFQSKGHLALKILQGLESGDGDNLLVNLALIEIHAELEQTERIASLIDRLMGLESIDIEIAGESISIRGSIAKHRHEMMPYVPDLKQIERIMAAYVSSRKQLRHD